MSETEENFFTPFKNEAKMPAKTTTTPCPKAKKKSISPERASFLVRVAKPIIEAKIGVEQGLAAKANKSPIKKG